MAFSVLSVRTGEELADPLYPEPGVQPNTVAAEAHDQSASVFYASALIVSVKDSAATEEQVVFKISDISAKVIVSDCRLAVACSKYDKGGGWSGFGIAGLAVAVTANAVSNARASHRRRGKTLIGHVRYQWLLTIVGRDKTGMMSRSTVRAILEDPTGIHGVIILDLILEKRQSGTALARDIATRASAYRLRSDRPVVAGTEAIAARNSDNGSVIWALPRFAPLSSE